MNLVRHKLIRQWLPLGLLALSVQSFLYLFTLIEYTVSNNNNVFSLNNFLMLWERWDVKHYLTLALGGYQNEGEKITSNVFFPLYPWMIRLLSFKTFHPTLISMLISTVAAVLSGVFLYQWIRPDYSESESKRAVWFFLIFPTSYFLWAGYAESLFICLALGALLAARQRHWPVCGVLAFLASLAKPFGIFLVPCLAYEALSEYRTSHKWRIAWLWLLGPIAAVVAYLYMQYQATGNAYSFLAVYENHWHQKPHWPWTAIMNSIDSFGRRSPDYKIMLVVFELFFILLGAISTFYAFFNRQITMAIWSSSCLLFFTSVGFLLSSPRHALIIFPIYIFLGRISKHETLFQIISFMSILLLAFFTIRFVHGVWAF